MALEPNPHLHPPGGFFFREADGTRFRGTSWNEVIEKVQFYRSQHGKPVGDVRAEIFAYVCRTSPTYCRDTEKPRPPSQPRPPRTPDAPRPAQPVPTGKGNVTSRASNWLHSLLALKRKSAVDYVPAPEARRRASICSQCPKQTSITGSCSGCMTVIKSVKAVILAGHAPVEKAIAGCACLGEDTSVSVHIVQAPSGDASLPANCWRRNQ